MKIIYRAVLSITCTTFLVGLFFLPMDYAVAKKEGKGHHKKSGLSGHPPGWDNVKGSGGKGKREKGVKESIKEELEDILGGGKGHHTTPGPHKRPPGWDEGEKVGWGGEDVPPGLLHKGKGHEGRTIKSKIKKKIKEKIDDALEGGGGKGKRNEGKGKE